MADIDTVFARINDVDTHLGEKIDALTSSIATLTASFAGEVRACQICRGIVLGNGKAAISDRVHSMEEWRGRLEAGSDVPLSARLKDIEEWRAGRKWFDRALIGAVLTCFAGAIVALLHWVPYLMDWNK